MSGVKKTAGKKNRSKSKTLNVYTKRVCKELGINSVNSDGLAVVDGAYRAFLSGLIKHTAKMLGSDKQRLTRKTAKLAFIAYMDSLVAPDEICQEALERADTAVESLFPDAK